MIVVGLTGGIGAGKSTFAALLERNGADVIDVDAVGRAVIAPGTPGAAAVEATFGTSDRRELARIVFSDTDARRALESISWPLIENHLREVVAVSKAEVVVLDMAVLPQGLGKGIYGPVVTVEANDEIRLARLQARGMEEQDARARMKAQTTEEQRAAIADFVVQNNGSEAELRAEADRVFREIHG